MSKAVCLKFNIQPSEFNWDMYADGWNGKNLKVNHAIKTKRGSKVYSHEAYAQELANKYAGIKNVVSKEVKKDTLVSINDFKIVNGNQLMATINNGSNNIIIDLNKEQKFLNMLQVNGNTLDKEGFINCVNTPELKTKILEMDLYAKVGTDVEKASIWEGYLKKIKDEMKSEITKKRKAYFATIISTNKGGFIVEIMNAIRAFMPGSMAAANKITDYESLVGQTMEVMVESYDPTYGFVVSRKKYLKMILPIKIQNLVDQLNKNQDTVFTGHITGSTPFGVFVEIDEYITGMLHKSLVSDATREAMRNNSIENGSEVKVYIHKIENNRVILSDVPTTERDAVIAKREAEDEAEKAERNQDKTPTEVTVELPVVSETNSDNVENVNA